MLSLEKFKIIFFITSLIYGNVYARPKVYDDVKSSKCGYESCTKPKDGMLNVHIVPHTHDDVGWLKTVDQYYYGSKSEIQKAGVQYIIDSVVQELLKDPNKKFIYVESAFFFKWWKEQTEELQEKVKMLVNEGRLEFIGGAWSMNDEATTHYQSIIDQFAWGLKQLNDTFGECGRPRIGWQIDPFGHSREMASIFAQMGYDGLFFGRLDYEDKINRLLSKTAEMIWNGSPNLGKSSDLFTGALFNQYQPPPGFCFDILCADQPIIDDKHSPDNNVDRRIQEFFNYVKLMSHGYRTKNVLITMGEDFHYQAAHMWYKNLDKLIKYGNEKQSTNNSDINLFYSTPSCYLKALHDSNIKWPTKQDDFFPYGSDSHSYWTGYFTSRPTLKRYERIGNHLLQVCKQLTTLSDKSNDHEFTSHLNYMRETMGIMQHHDAVTGTEKQKVAYDYAKRLDVGIRACSANIKSILHKMVTGDYPKDINVNTENEKHNYKRTYKFSFNNCLLLNISQCEITETKNQFIVTVYNPLPRSTYENIRFPVASTSYNVMDYRNVPIPSQIIKVPTSILNLNFRKSNSQYELLFLASELPPMGYKSYYITKINENSIIKGEIKEKIDNYNYDKNDNDKEITIGNKNLKITFTDGLLSHIESIANGISLNITQEFAYYEGMNGGNENAAHRASGAYIFRPNGTETILINSNPKINVIRGKLVEEVHQTFNDWVSQVVRIYKEDNHVEFEWLVGGIPIDDNIGKEIITRFNTDIKSNGIFYTDSNGREMIKRKRNHRDTWNLTITEEISGNYYPLTTKIALEDNEKRLAILVDRAQAGSSITDGSLEIMIHRRLLKDDSFGVGEPLNETAYGSGLIARGHHYLIFGSKSDSISPTTEAQERFLQIEKLLPVWTFMSDAGNYSYENWQKEFTHISSGVSLALPKQISLMTFEPWHNNEILIRFEHLFEKNEDPEFSKPVTFNLKDIFYNMQIDSLRETTLDGNQWLNEMQRLNFTAEENQGDEIELENKNDKIEVILKMKRAVIPNLLNIDKDNTKESFLPKAEDDIFILTINPMQIRTFIIKLVEKV